MLITGSNDLKYPPVPAISSETWTVSGQAYGNGNYISSGVVANSHTVFDGSKRNSLMMGGGHYDTITGEYSHTNSLNEISGDWVIIQLPSAILLHYYKIYSRAPSTIPVLIKKNVYCLVVIIIHHKTMSSDQ